MSEFLVHIADRLKRKREKLNISPKALADELGVSLTSYYRYEAGERSIPADKLLTLCKRINISFEYFARGLDDQQKTNEQRYRVLIVEDDPGDAYLLRSELTKIDPHLDVFCFKRAEDAKEYLLTEEIRANGGFDLAFVDLNLPGDDGHAFIKKMRSYPDYAHKTFLMLTNDGGDHTKSISSRLKVSTHIVKAPHIEEYRSNLRVCFNYWRQFPSQENTVKGV